MKLYNFKNTILLQSVMISIVVFTLIAGVCGGFCPAAVAATAGPAVLASAPVPPNGTGGSRATSAAAMGVSSGHDLDMLWARAGKDFDLSKYDAVLLLESARVTVLYGEDGRTTRTTVHRVAWIGTEIGIDTHADLRIPWNSANSTFSVIKLRTWREGRWWPDETAVSPTAVVETLPFEVALADDYSTMRETMLLHDGVELPCIMETEYTIEETVEGPGGADGFFVLACREPAVLVEYIVETSGGLPFAFHSGNGAPAPVESSNPQSPGAAGNGGMKTYRWSVEKSGGLGYPQSADPSSYAPCACWSTWRDWNAPGDLFAKRFDEAAVLERALADTLASRLSGEPTDASKARKISAFVGKSTRPVHYDSRFHLFSPRASARVYETAYGDALDRAVLAAAMFRSAGLSARPVFRSTELGSVEPDIPGFSRFGEVFVCVSGDRFDALYDPLESALLDRQGMNFGRTLWRPGTGEAPQLRPDPAAAGAGSRFELLLTLERGEGDTWKGTGFYRVDGLFSPFVAMSGLGGEARAHIGALAGSALGGATVTDHSVEVFDCARVDVGFGFSLEKPEQDDAGRTKFAAGDPEGGIFARLPGDVRLSHEKRTSSAVLPGKMTQHIRLRLNTGGMKIIHRPETRKVENEAGSFSLDVVFKDGWLTIDRTLTLRGGVVAPAAWPALRALLLEERDTANRTALLK